MKNKGQKQVGTAVNKQKRPRSNPQGSARYKGQLCAKKCNFWTCTTYKCLGDKICCSPGKPASKCCPRSKPLCIRNKCCARGYPILCGNWCCRSGTFCCNGRACCRSRNSCCGSSCCAPNHPCCRGKCCNKYNRACCDQYGCVSPCPSQMDAVGCFISISRSLSHDLRAIPSKLYRVLRPDENAARIVAKDPRATRTVLSHVNCGSRAGYKSQFISTSASLDVARRYRDRFQAQRNVTLRIGEFDTNQLRGQRCQMIDLTTEAGRNQHLGRAVMAKNFAKASQEVVLKCDTPLRCRVIE